MESGTCASAKNIAVRSTTPSTVASLLKGLPGVFDFSNAAMSGASSVAQAKVEVKQEEDEATEKVPTLIPNKHWKQVVGHGKLIYDVLKREHTRRLIRQASRTPVELWAAISGQNKETAKRELDRKPSFKKAPALKGSVYKSFLRKKYEEKKLEQFYERREKAEEQLKKEEEEAQAAKKDRFAPSPTPEEERRKKAKEEKQKRFERSPSPDPRLKKKTYLDEAVLSDKALREDEQRRKKKKEDDEKKKRFERSPTPDEQRHTKKKEEEKKKKRERSPTIPKEQYKKKKEEDKKKRFDRSETPIEQRRKQKKKDDGGSGR